MAMQGGFRGGSGLIRKRQRPANAGRVERRATTKEYLAGFLHFRMLGEPQFVRRGGRRVADEHHDAGDDGQGRDGDGAVFDWSHDGVLVIWKRGFSGWRGRWPRWPAERRRARTSRREQR